MKRKIIIFISLCIAAIVILIAACNIIVAISTSGKTFDDAEEIPRNKYAVLLATSPVTRDGAHNYYFENRIKAADELYRAGKVEYIIASGGDYRKNEKFGCDEPGAIRDSLVARGIPQDHIILDYEGTRTLNSIVKAKDVYKLDSVTFISQKGHNQRAIYLAQRYGMNAVGYDAKPSPIVKNVIKNRLREYVAKVKMFIDIIGGKKADVSDNNGGLGLKAMGASMDYKSRLRESLSCASHVDKNYKPVEIIDTCDLRIYFPEYSKIDLVCGEIPSKNDSTVIMFAGAAFTGELLDSFRHFNIAGDHVTGGSREKGYPCKRNNGAFVYYNGNPKFVYQNYSAEMDKAAANGGCAFGQEMMIHKGKEVPHTRKAANKNEFRALCLINGKVAIADSFGIVSFGDFINNLLKAGATEAMYLDMGLGWNYSWYRDENYNVVEIHLIPTKYSTNWITFYK